MWKLCVKRMFQRFQWPEKSEVQQLEKSAFENFKSIIYDIYVESSLKTPFLSLQCFESWNCVVWFE